MGYKHVGKNDHKELNWKYWHSVILLSAKYPYAEVRQFSNTCQTRDTSRSEKALKIEMNQAWLKMGSSVHGEPVALVLRSPVLDPACPTSSCCDLRQGMCSFSDFQFPTYKNEMGIINLPNLWQELNELPVPKCLRRLSPKEESGKDCSKRKPSIPHERDFPEKTHLSPGQSIYY